jgi:hypothetical protein
MMLASIGGLVAEPLAILGGCLGWIAGFLLLTRLKRRQRALVVTLVAAGLGGVAWGAANGSAPEWDTILAGNQPLIGMLVAVSFLRLVARPAKEGEGPAGKGAVWQSLLAVHIFGSVINISAVDLVGDRLARGVRLDKPRLLLLSRGYSTGAFWSPFWGASATVLTYSPAARLPVLMAIGGNLSALALAMGGLKVIRTMGRQLPGFHGYPLTLDALGLPVALVGIVLAWHFASPDVPVNGIITVCAPLLTCAILLVTARRRTPRALAGHAVRQLPQMGGELTLFLAAGMLTAGFAAIVDQAGTGWLPFDSFGPLEAWGLLLLMAVLAGLGLHPVISIATGASLLAPLDADPTLFAMTGLIAWGVQAAGAPLSGFNVVMGARFGVDTFRLASWNLLYVLAMLALGLPALWVCAELVGAG